MFVVDMDSILDAIIADHHFFATSLIRSKLAEVAAEHLK